MMKNDCDVKFTPPVSRLNMKNNVSHPVKRAEEGNIILLNLQ